MSSLTEMQLRDQLTEQLENTPFMNSNGLPAETAPHFDGSPFYVGENSNGQFFWNFGYGYQLTDVASSLNAIENTLLGIYPLDASKLQTTFNNISSIINSGFDKTLVN